MVAQTVRCYLYTRRVCLTTLEKIHRLFIRFIFYLRKNKRIKNLRRVAGKFYDYLKLRTRYYHRQMQQKYAGIKQLVHGQKLMVSPIPPIPPIPPNVRQIPGDVLRSRRYNLITGGLVLLITLVLFMLPIPTDDQVEVNSTKAPVHQQVIAHKLSRFVPPMSIINSPIYKHRRAHVTHECRSKHSDQWSSLVMRGPNFTTSQPIVSTKHRLMYCPVGKVGSNFFTRYIVSLDEPGLLKSPYTVPGGQAARVKCKSLKSLGDQRQEFLRTAVKMVIGRDPYSRIFSAYIDKLYSPNPYFWKTWGQQALKVAGLKTKGACASGVTFKQFVNLVVTTLVRTDGLLRPVFAECQMCHVVYDLIAQMETITDDVEFLTKTLNASTAFLHQTSYSVDVRMDAITDSVNSAFSWKKDFQACEFSLDKMAMRIWRKLQIRGIIDRKFSYPFKEGEVEKMKSSTFVAACRSAMEKSTDKVRLNTQKTQALVEAYSSVSVEKIKKIAEVYREDFSAFDYDISPQSLFSGRTEVNQTDFLNWRTDWKI